jgi:hypothetical protein
MRALIMAFAIAAALFAAPAAFAAPTCQDKDGYTIRCGTPGAMPVGWSASSEQLLDRQTSAPTEPDANQLLGLILIIGGVSALLALMPEFDGWRAGDWDKQEKDDEERG